MNNPNPLVPQGSMLEQQQKSKSNVYIAVLAILSFHAVLLGALLFQGCKKETPPPPPTPTNVVETTPAVSLPLLPPVDTNPTPSVPPTLLPITPLPPLPAPDTKEHTVIKGDSFSKLSKRYGVTVDAISKANPGVDSSRLKVGQKLVIPVAASPTAAPDGLAPTTGAGETIHVVKAGETLARIARAHGITVKELKAANGLKTDAIRAGQKLKVPAKSAPATPPEPAPLTPPGAPAPAPIPPSGAPAPAGSPASPALGTRPSPA